jgi:hypothetical protein
MLKDMKKIWLMEQAQRVPSFDDEAPKNKISISKEWLAKFLYENASILGWEDGRQPENKNPFNSETETEYFREYEDEFQTRRNEVQEEDAAAEKVDEPEPKSEFSVEAIKVLKPYEVTEEMREWMRDQGWVFTSAGWTAKLVMPKSSVKREKRASKGSVRPIVETELRKGTSDEDIIKLIKKAIPEAKTTSNCIAWYASKLRGRGVSLPNRPRNVGKKAKGSTAE